MRWIEIIELRSLGKVDILMELNLQDLMGELVSEEKPFEIRIYRHGETETDWSLHLHYHSSLKTVCKSKFGTRFAALMTDFGCVHHSIWMESKNSREPDRTGLQ